MAYSYNNKESKESHSMSNDILNKYKIDQNIKEEDIMNHIDIIKQTEVETIPFVGPIESISILFDEYKENKIFHQCISLIQEKHYTTYRRIRRDGNCFYRCFAYALIEGLSIFSKLYDINQFFEQGLQNLIKQGYEEIIIEDFFETVTEKITHYLTIPPDSEIILSDMNNQEISDSFVFVLRLLCSLELVRNCDNYKPFIEDCFIMESYVKSQVEPLYREADHIHILALCNLFKVSISLIHLNSKSEFELTNDVIGIGPIFCTLLFRPGHYDLLYKK